MARNISQLSNKHMRKSLVAPTDIALTTCDYLINRQRCCSGTLRGCFGLIQTCTSIFFKINLHNSDFSALGKCQRLSNQALDQFISLLPTLFFSPHGRFSTSMHVYQLIAASPNQLCFIKIPNHINLELLRHLLCANKFILPFYSS